MTQTRSTPELQAIEDALMELHSVAPRMELRSRALTAVRSELRYGWYRRSGALVAAVLVATLLWGNLSLTLTRTSTMTALTGNSATAVEQNRRLIRDLLPDITAREATRHATVVACGSRLAHCPYPTGSPVTTPSPYDERIR
jgi:hypothetical protein